jgi:hypothetical protein
MVEKRTDPPEKAYCCVENGSQTGNHRAWNVVGASNQHRWRFHRARGLIHLLLWLAVLSADASAGFAPCLENHIDTHNTPSPRRTAHHYGTNFISVPMAPVPMAVAPAPVTSASTAATAAAPPPASATYPNADATAASASVMATPATVTSAAVMAPSTAVAAVPSTAVAAVTTMADKLYE